MAFLSIKQYVGNGILTDYLFDIPYIKDADVHGYVDGVEVSISFVDPTTVRFAVAPADQSEIDIKRLTDNATPRHTFPNRTYITSTRLDGNSYQGLYLDQESIDATAIAQETADVSADAAAASAAAAAASETNAATSETNAATSETNAATSETNAAVSETNAAASEAAAAGTLANAVTKDGLTPMNSGANLPFSGGGAPTGLPATPDATEAASKEYVDTHVEKAGDTMDSAANLTFAGGGEVIGLPATPGATAASSKEYTDAQDALKLDLAGGTVTGQIKGITPVAPEDLARKDYVDAASGGGYKGALAYRNTQSTANTGGNISFQAESFDTGGFWVIGSPTRMTIPAGVSKVRLHANMEAGNGGIDLGIEFMKNNSPAFIGNSGSVHSNSYTPGTPDNQVSVHSGAIPVVENDYFEVRQTKSASWGERQTRTWFELEVLE